MGLYLSALTDSQPTTNTSSKYEHLSSTQSDGGGVSGVYHSKTKMLEEMSSKRESSKAWCLVASWDPGTTLLVSDYGIKH